jgi:hypothetical protein
MYLISANSSIPRAILFDRPCVSLKVWGLERTGPNLIVETGSAGPFCNIERKLFVKDWICALPR